MRQAPGGHDGPVVQGRARHEPSVQLRLPILIEHGPVPRVEGPVGLQGGPGLRHDRQRARLPVQWDSPRIERLLKPSPVLVQHGVGDVPRPAVNKQKGPVRLDLVAAQGESHPGTTKS
jgi:hypothetical protein